MSANRREAAVQQSGEGGRGRKQSGLRRVVSHVAEPIVEEPSPLPPPLPHIPGLPTPAELQLAAQQRISPLSPIVVVRTPDVPRTPPRPFLPPQSVRRAFLSQMQPEPPPGRIWPWLLLAFIFSATGITLGVLGLR
jgi:hypothetical protein